MTEAILFAQWIYKKGWSVRGGIGSTMIWVQRKDYAWGEEPERITTEELYKRFENETGEKMEYRIAEYAGRYIIQAKMKKTTGMWWWKKTWEYWSDVNTSGEPVYREMTGKYRFSNSPTLQPFFTMESAVKMVEAFQNGPRIHNIKKPKTMIPDVPKEELGKYAGIE